MTLLLLATLTDFRKGVAALLLVGAMVAVSVAFLFRFFLSGRDFSNELTFRCPYCGAVFTVPRFQPSIHFIRRRMVRCPVCGRSFLGLPM